MAKQINPELQRVNINLPGSIVEKVKAYANNLGINVTSAYIVLLNQALEQKEAMNQLPQIFSLFAQMQAFNTKDLSQTLLTDNNNSK